MENSVKINKKDLKILHELDYNARMPLSELAKKVGLSTQLVKYRLDNLFRNKIIVGTMAVVDLHRLGFFTYRIYLRFQKTSEKNELEIIEYFKKHPRCIWVVSTSGRWDLEVLFSARNPIQVNIFLHEIKGKLGQYMKNYTISPSMVNYHFERAYLVGEREQKERNLWYGFEPPQEKLDELDVRILKFLSLDARVSTQEIARELKISFNTAKQRIAKMEGKGIIQSYRILIDLGKIGRMYYKSIITTGSFSEVDEKKMLSFCMAEPTIVYLIECFGEWDVELEAEVNDEAEFRDIMARFRNRFAELTQNYELLHVYKEHKLNYFPMADELLRRIDK